MHGPSSESGQCGNGEEEKAMGKARSADGAKQVAGTAKAWITP